MNDASEVLYTLYESINSSAGAASPVDAIFGLAVKEGVHCHCGRTTHNQVQSGFRVHARTTPSSLALYIALIAFLANATKAALAVVRRTSQWRVLE